MAAWNVKVVSFVVGATTFDATAAGVYADKGSAAGKKPVNRMEITPWGATYDMDGSDDAALSLPQVWNDFTFASASPASHAQYSVLASLIGKVGTLSVKIPFVSYDLTYTATARMLEFPDDSRWESPYKRGVTNWLMIRGVWQLKTAFV